MRSVFTLRCRFFFSLDVHIFPSHLGGLSESQVKKFPLKKDVFLSMCVFSFDATGRNTSCGKRNSTSVALINVDDKLLLNQVIENGLVRIFFLSFCHFIEKEGYDKNERMKKRKDIKHRQTLGETIEEHIYIYIYIRFHVISLLFLLMLNESNTKASRKCKYFERKFF